MTRSLSSGFTLDDLRQHDLAISHLGHALARAQVFLLLGAGVSQGLGLPDWAELVSLCEKEVGIVHTLPNPRKSEDLTKAMQTVREKAPKDFANVVRKALYSTLAEDRYPDSLYTLPMLAALGALVMSSARSAVGDVFTLNFDDVLESYLDFHGFQTQSLNEFPADLRGDVDVHIFHLHGSLPLDRKRPASKDLILSQTEFIARISKDADGPWPTVLRSRLLSGVMLAIGTSMSDLDIKVALRKARDAIRTRPLGFVICIGSSHNENALLEEGLVPLTVEHEGEVAPLILRICQSAANARGV